MGTTATAERTTTATMRIERTQQVLQAAGAAIDERRKLDPSECNCPEFCRLDHEND
jgi:hypothetical protein